MPSATQHPTPNTQHPVWRQSNRKVFGLTGGIASGKSTALQYFQEFGAQVLDADRIAKEVVQPKRKAWKKIVSVFGKEILKQDGSIDRSQLGKIVFDSVKKRKQLEAIVHPEVVQVLKKKIKQLKRGVFIVDIPLLFEAGLQNLVEQVIVVWVPKKLQIQRLRKRNGLSLKECSIRLGAQTPLSEKKRSADFILDNSKSFADLKKKIKNFLLTNQNKIK